MRIIHDRPRTVEIEEFLSRPLFAHLATGSEDGPRDSPVWFLWEHGALWIIASRSRDTFPSRIEREARCAVGVVDFDASSGVVQHVGFRGRATVEPLDQARARRLLRRYLGDDESAWAQRFSFDPDDDILVRFEPQTVVARDLSYVCSSSPGALELQPYDVYSQFGEDGILQSLLARLGVSGGYCVEFGAGDGIALSNTYNLIRNHSWNGLLIEADAVRFDQLRSNMKPHAGVSCLQSVVGFDQADGLDSILRRTDAPEDFELLSIDIDGNDYHVWSAITAYRPQVVVVEFNPTIPTHVEFIQPRDMGTKQGSSILSLAGLAQRKGYRPVAATWANVVFVRADVADAAALPVSPLESIRTDHVSETSILQLYDGTIKVVGPTRGLWNDIEMRGLGIQSLPRFLRVYPPDARWWQTALVRVAWRESQLRLRARRRLWAAIGDRGLRRRH